MIEYLYKYTQIREDFFKKPMLRATPLCDLNDPFEGAVTLEHVENLKKQSYDVLQEDCNEDSVGLVQLDLQEVGVLAFTEEALSPIMWSHYASEHNGMVIKLKTNKPFLLGAKIHDELKDDVFGLIHEMPKPVKYSRYRQLSEFPDEISNRRDKGYQYANLNIRLLYTKANDWMYEKEHRSVLLLKNADVIIFDKNNELIKFCSKYHKIKVKKDKENKNKYKIIYPINYELEENMGDESIRSEIYSRVKYLNPIYLYKINPDCISGIIFGCRVHNKNLKKHVSLIKKHNQKYALYQTEIMEDRYELKLNLLD